MKNWKSKISGSRSVEDPARDRGVILMWFAIATVAMLGLGAIVIDVGALMSERRQLQNGADASALAVAIDASDKKCANGNCGPGYQVLAQNYANANAQDKTSAVETLCGKGPGLDPCVGYTPPSAVGTANWVRVKLKTMRPSGSDPDQIKFLLAPVLDAARVGQTVRASATVAWGSPSSANVLPFVISKCDIEPFRNAATGKLEFPTEPMAIYMQDVTKDMTDSADMNDLYPLEKCTLNFKWPKGFAYTGEETDPPRGKNKNPVCQKARLRLDATDPLTGQQTGTVFGKNGGKKMASACTTVMKSYIAQDRPIVVPVVIERINDKKNPNRLERIQWKFDGFIAIKVCAYDMTGSKNPDVSTCKNADGSRSDICDVVSTKDLDGDYKKYVERVVNGRRICGVPVAWTFTDGDLGGPSDYLSTVIKLVS